MEKEKQTLDKIELYNIAHSIMIHPQFSRNILYSHYNLNGRTFF
jgi:hypothetical protein